MDIKPETRLQTKKNIMFGMTQNVKHYGKTLLMMNVLIFI